MADRTVAILGGRGMLGSDLTQLCSQKQLDTDVLDLPEFDITDAEQLAEAVESASIIVNCAAYTNVDGAETEADLAHRINAEAVGRLGDIAARAGKYVVHISTDFVFDGQGDGSYTETDATNPINEYGASKLAGEQLLADSGCDHCIIRVQWTYGRAGNNFPAKILDRAKAGQPLNVVDDQIGSPTATTEVAAAILEMIEKRPVGLFHFANDGYASRYEVARFILSTAGVDCELTPCKTSDYVSPAKRPLNSRFDCTKIKDLLSEPIRPWRQTMEEFLRQL